VTALHTRRSLLGAAGTVALAGLAGCSALPGSRELAHYVEVANRTDATHNVFVRVTDDGGTDLYRQGFRLDGESVREVTEPFTGEPSTVAITVDGAAPVEKEWPPDRCDERGVRSAGGAAVSLRDEGLTVDLACDTVYADG
jgi:hypothetical protein